MDTYNSAPFDDAEAEHICLEAAVAKARSNQSPGRPHLAVRQEMLEKIAELDRRIATLVAK